MQNRAVVRSQLVLPRCWEHCLACHKIHTVIHIALCIASILLFVFHSVTTWPKYLVCMILILWNGRVFACLNSSVEYDQFLSMFHVPLIKYLTSCSSQTAGFIACVFSPLKSRQKVSRYLWTPSLPFEVSTGGEHTLSSHFGPRAIDSLILISDIRYDITS